MCEIWSHQRLSHWLHDYIRPYDSFIDESAVSGVCVLSAHCRLASGSWHLLCQKQVPIDRPDCPGRRLSGDFPATGRPPGAEALAVAGAGPRGRRDLLVLANDPPVTVTASRQRAQDGHTIFGMSRLRSAGSSAQSLAAVAVAPRPSTSSRNPCAW